jgi:hypothetical protein
MQGNAKQGNATKAEAEATVEARKNVAAVHAEFEFMSTAST